MTFENFLFECAKNVDLVAEFDRLQGSNLARRGTTIDLAIDDATGRTTDDARAFIAFAADLWARLRSSGDDR
jgi:hypothetical protein